VGISARKTGQLYLQKIGVNYYKARMYHPKLGRFLQTDLVGYEDQMNLYAYVHNDPINATDPSGKITKLLKTAWNVGKKAFKNGGDFKKAIKEEAADIASNVAELADGNWSVDDVYAAVDLTTGFGDEAKKGAKLIDSTGALKPKSGTKAMTLDTKAADNALYNSLESVGPNPEKGPTVKPQTTFQKIVEGARSVSRIFTGDD
jgi:RHS repeat-associated protein